MINKIDGQLTKYLREFFSGENFMPGPDTVLVIGCSTSEIVGQHIGKCTNGEIGKVVVETILRETAHLPIHVAFQCCEHLNRALVVEEELALAKGWEIVNVHPVLTAGGGLATNAYELLKKPAVVEHIEADYGIDIGDTFIGMHVKFVQVPLRLPTKKVGEASIKGLFARKKLIGGARAQYE